MINRKYMLKVSTPLFFLFMGYCSKEVKTSRKLNPEIRLHVIGQMRNYFLPIEQNVYDQTQMPFVWDRMNSVSETFCRQYSSKYVPSDKVARDFIKPDAWAIIKKQTGLKIAFNRVLLGCRNFFQLNDIRPDHVFDLVGKLYPTRKFDCYTVGFMQAYLMPNSIQCARITVMDINWQILRAHFEMYRGILRSPENSGLENILSQVKLSWITNMGSKGYVSLKPATLPDLCRKSQINMCREKLQNLLQNPGVLPDFELQLTHLKDADYHPETPVHKLIFFSNALESFYTSKEEFADLMENIRKSLQPGQPALAIFHAGGRAEFGIYELTKETDAIKTTVVCRDNYMSADAVPVPVSTHFEKITPKGGPKCAQLLKKLSQPGT